MSIVLYDTAISKKISGWFDESKICILKPDEVARLLQLKANQNFDREITLPLVSISRESDIDVDASKRPMTFDGLLLKSTTSMELEDHVPVAGKDMSDKQVIKSFKGGKSVMLNAIPMKLSYQIDIYAKRLVEADAIVRDLLFKLTNKPKMKISIPYNSNEMRDKEGNQECVEHVANIKVKSPIMDNSDVNTNKLYFDEFTRFTIKIDIDDAYFWSVPVVNNVFMNEGTTEVKNHREIEDEKK